MAVPEQAYNISKLLSIKSAHKLSSRIDLSVLQNQKTMLDSYIHLQPNADQIF